MGEFTDILKLNLKSRLNPPLQDFRLGLLETRFVWSRHLILEF
jgi:hypothetical protein